MASLTGNTIQSTYDSLLKVTDNDSITGSLKRITDGLGNNTPLYLSNSAVEIVSALNVTGAITGSNLSGTNTGDETKASIETKLGAATSSNSGYLTSTDWSTFNNKIAGTGTLNKLAKFSSSSSIADSTITDTGSAVTIGVATSVTGSLTASSIIKSGGTASQILAADGSVITAGTNITISGGTISSSGGISGSGTTNTIPKFTGSTSLGNSNISDSGTLITAGSNTYINGRLGVGITASSLYGVVVTSPISGGTNLFGILSNGQIQSDATNSAAYYGAVTNTVAGSYTIPVVRHFIANQGTIGAGSIISTQTGFEAAAALTAGVSNYGFRGQIVAAIENYNLFMNGTAKNYMTGDLGVGSSQNFVSSGPILTTTLTNGGSGYVDGTYTDVASVANSGSGVGALFTVVVSGGIVTSATLTWAGSNYRVSDTITISNTLLGGTGSGLVITVATVDSSQLKVANANGGDITLARADASLALNDNIGSIKFENNDTSTKASGLQARISAYGQGSAGGAYLSFFTRSATAGTSLVEAMRILDNSNVNIVTGGLGIANTALTGYSIRASKNITGSTTSFGISVDGSIQSDVTNTATYYRTNSATAAASFTVGNINHYQASQGTLGAGSTVNNQNGFIATSTLIGATSNFGFRGLIPSGTGRWNLYMDGTADNYLAGNLGIGTTSPTQKLQVGDGTGTGNQYIRVFSSSADIYIGQSNATIFGLAANSAGLIIGDKSTFPLAVGTYYSQPLILATNNAERMRILSNGNVGIGTTSPGYKLQIGDGTASGSQYFRIVNSGSDIYIGQSGGTIFGLSANSASLILSDQASNPLGVGTTQSQALVLGTANTERMRITSGGLVGIGTSSPAFSLDTVSPANAQQAIRISNQNSGSSAYSTLIAASYGNSWGFRVGSAAANNNNLDFVVDANNGGTSRMTITTGGNVGIGCTPNYGKLEIQGSTTDKRLYIGTNIYYSNSIDILGLNSIGGEIPLGISGSQLQFFTNASERMRITSGGSLLLGGTSLAGYGGSTPKLEIYGSNYSSSDADAATTVLYGTSNTTGSGGAIAFGSSATSFYATFARVRGVKDSSTSGEYGGGIAFDTRQNLSSFSERMRITSAGNVGIGTTSPGAKLQVIGDIATSTRVATDTINGYTGGGTPLTIQTGGAQDVIFGTNATERMRLNTSGNLLIGTTSDLFNNAKLQVNGGMTYLNLFNRRTASYTLSASDQNYIVEMNVGSANNLTVPPNSSVAFPIGTEIAVLQYGAGQTTIVAGSGVTLKSKSNALKISGQYAGCTLVKVGTDEWYVVGDLTL